MNDTDYTTLIAVSDARALVGVPSVVFVDCRFSLDDTGRGRRAYRDGHIPRARYAHLDDDLSGPVVAGATGRHPLPHPDTLAETLGRWGIAPATQVVAYDDMGGAIAARLWWLMRWVGHARVAVLDGGWPRWTAEGGPVDTDMPAGEPGRYPVQPDARWIAEVDEVAENTGIALLDARAADRYAGRVEPIDPVAGHIPGARSLPFAQNLETDGRMRSIDALRARFAPYFEGRDDASDVVCYCGSGVTAAHNVLAMAHAGYHGARMYPGSWSAWITDPNRPVATGDDPS